MKYHFSELEYVVQFNNYDGNINVEFRIPIQRIDNDIYITISKIHEKIIEKTEKLVSPWTFDDIYRYLIPRLLTGAKNNGKLTGEYSCATDMIMDYNLASDQNGYNPYMFVILDEPLLFKPLVRYNSPIRNMLIMSEIGIKTKEGTFQGRRVSVHHYEKKDDQIFSFDRKDVLYLG